MNLAKPLCFLLICAFPLSAAMAADDATSPAASEQFRIPTVQTGSGPSSLLRPTNKGDDSVILPMEPRGQRIEVSPFAGVCFTMRTYKVKPTERVRDNESGATGYSTCQMGSNFRIRSANGSTSK